MKAILRSRVIPAQTMAATIPARAAMRLPADEEVAVPAEDDLPGDEDAGVPVEISNTTLTLTWEPNAGELEGYIVYFGPSASAVTEETSDIKAFAGSFDPEAPLVRYDSWFDLGLEPGDQACFKLRAYNADGISDSSAPACSVIPHSI